MPAQLKNIRTKFVSIVDKGANFDPATGEGAHILICKRDLSAEKRHALPDHCYAAVWTDAQGASQRKLPYKHADGSTDKAHLQNALARINQTEMPADIRTKARAALEAASKKESAVANPKKSTTSKSMAVRLAKALAQVFGKDAAMSMAAPAAVDAEAMKAQHAALGHVIAGYGEGPHPPEHPIHALKALHEDMGKQITASSAIGPQETLDDDDAVDAEENALGKLATHPTIVALSKRAEDAEARAKAAESMAKGEKDRRELEEAKVILKSFSHVTVDVEKDASVLRELQATKPEIAKRVLELLKGAEGQLATSSTLTKQLGTEASAGASGSAWAQIEAKSAELMQKDGTLTHAKAIVKAMDANPTLVKRHDQEQRAQ